MHASLGAQHTVDLTGGRIAYAERGSGPPVVLVHGVLVNGDLWRKVVPAIADAGLRAITPTWPLGSHELAMNPDADLTPRGLAALMAEFLAALDLSEVTVVANDTGGALTQILMTEHPERIGRVVLTPCDAFTDFLPDPFAQLPTLIRLPGSAWLSSRLTQLGAVRRSPIGFGWIAKRPIPPEIADSYLKPWYRDPRVRRDARRFLSTIHHRYTVEAARRLPEFDRPVLLVRATEDRVFKPALADRLAQLLPDARIVEVADSYTFVPEDQPAELARLIVEFAGAERAAGSQWPGNVSRIAPERPEPR